MALTAVGEIGFGDRDSKPGQRLAEQLTAFPDEGELAIFLCSWALADPEATSFRASRARNRPNTATGQVATSASSNGPIKHLLRTSALQRLGLTHHGDDPQSAP